MSHSIIFCAFLVSVIAHKTTWGGEPGDRDLMSSLLPHGRSLVLVSGAVHGGAEFEGVLPDAPTVPRALATVRLEIRASDKAPLVIWAGLDYPWLGDVLDMKIADNGTVLLARAGGVAPGLYRIYLLSGKCEVAAVPREWTRNAVPRLLSRKDVNVSLSVPATDGRVSAEVVDLRDSGRITRFVQKKGTWEFEPAFGTATRSGQ